MPSRSGHQTGGGDAVKLIFLFAIDKEKRFVLLDGAANGTTELVQVKFFRRLSEEALSVKVRIAEELEERAVKIVGAGPGGDQDGGSGARAVLR
jgi:hypothetical protein